VNASAAAPPLLFSWSTPQPHYRTLVLFLIASALLHALCFYVFQVVYPSAIALSPTSARLNVISPDDAESIALLRWVEAEDPALASTTLRPPDYRAFALPKLAHIPSYENHQPGLRTLPRTTPDLAVPSSAAIGQMPRPRLKAALPLMPRKTAAVFSDLPAQLSSPVFPVFAFHLSRADAPANARFRVAIDSGGAIQYCFLIESSGDPALDDEARKFLMLCRFVSPGEGDATNPAAKTDGHLRWSVATILWGNDFSSPPPAP
jgi:hypothetical protein